MLAILAAALLAGGCGAQDAENHLTYHPVPGVTPKQSAEIERVLIKRLTAAGVKQANVSAIGCDVVVSFAGGDAAATRAKVKAVTAQGDGPRRVIVRAGDHRYVLEESLR